MTLTVEKQAIAELQLRQLSKASKAGDHAGTRFANLLARAARQAMRNGREVRVSEEEALRLINETAKVSAAAYVQEAGRMKRYHGLALSFVSEQKKAAAELELDLGDLRKRFVTMTGRPLRRSMAKLQMDVNRAIRDVLKQRLSKRKSEELLTIRLEKLGVIAKTPNVIKTWIRTGTSFAANAARWDISQNSPTTWGYTYVTMQDDRVREEHENMEGYTRKMDDPIWLEIWPPNGWNCRCQVVVLTEPERQSRIDYNIVDNVPEEFRFNAGVEFLERNAVLSLADSCGAGSPGGKGFRKGNTCQKGYGGREAAPKELARRIPPAWTDVQVNLDPTADRLVTGRDAKGRLQSIYSEEYGKRKSREKYEKIRKMLKSHGSMEFDDSEEGQVLSLIHATGIRPGSRRDTKSEKQAYGAVTLLGNHVKKTPDGVVLKFTGKKGVDLEIPVNDDRVAQMLLKRKRKAGSKGELFDTTARELRQHSKKRHGYNPKDFRTGIGTLAARREVARMEKPKDKKQRKAQIKEVAKVVARRLGNTPAIALQSYIDPAVFEAWK